MTLKRFLFLFAIAAAVAGVLRYFVFEGIYIASASMEPTLGVGSHLFLDKTTYIFRAPRRGDIIVFSAPVPPHKEMVKRVVAVAGDSVEDIKCYLTGAPKGVAESTDDYAIKRYAITDKHGRSRDVYNAKVNIYRRGAAPIFLGVQTTDLDGFKYDREEFV